MEYAKHNFYSNFAGFVKANDVEMQRDLYVNELTSLIVANPMQIEEELSALDVEFPKNYTPEQMALIIFNNLKNPRVQFRIAKLICDKNGVYEYCQKNIKPAKVKGGFANATAGGVADSITAITNATTQLANIGKEFGGTAAQRKMQENEIALQREANKAKLIEAVINKTRSEGNPSAGNGMTGWQAGGLIILAIGATLLLVKLLSGKTATA